MALVANAWAGQSFSRIFRCSGKMRRSRLLRDRSGPNQWRDSQTPRQILEYWCELNSLNKPQYLGNTQLVLDGKVYNLTEYGKETDWIICKITRFDQESEFSNHL